MSDVVIAVLVAALILQTVAFLYYINQKDIREGNERWALQERIREPEQLISPPSIVNKIDPEPAFIEDPVQDEIDLVGAVNPDVNRDE